MQTRSKSQTRNSVVDVIANASTGTQQQRGRPESKPKSKMGKGKSETSSARESVNGPAMQDVSLSASQRPRRARNSTKGKALEASGTVVGTGATAEPSVANGGAAGADIAPSREAAGEGAGGEGAVIPTGSSVVTTPATSATTSGVTSGADTPASIGSKRKAGDDSDDEVELLEAYDRVLTDLVGPFVSLSFMIKIYFI